MKIENFICSVPQGEESSVGYVKLAHGTQYTLNLQNCNSRRCTAKVSIDGKDIGLFRINGHESLNLERPSMASGEDGKFTFYRSGSSEAKKAKESKVKNSDRGLISVTFTLEKENQVVEVEDQSISPFLPYQPLRRWSPWVLPYYPTWSDRNVSYETSSILSYSNESCYADGNQISSVNTVFSAKNEEPTNSKSIERSGLNSGVTGLSGHSDQKFKTVPKLEYDYTTTATINLRLVVDERNSGVRELPKKARSNNVPPALN